MQIQIVDLDMDNKCSIAISINIILVVCSTDPFNADIKEKDPSENITPVYRHSTTVQKIRKIKKKCKILCNSEVTEICTVPFMCTMPCSQVLNPDSLLLGEVCDYL